MSTVTGKSAKIVIMSGSTAKDHSVWGISDFTLTFDRGTVEQELVGEIGNYWAQGALAVEGSYTMARFAASGNHDTLAGLVDSDLVTISGNIDTSATTKISWRFVSSQITGYDIAVGDADTITEASIDFVVLDPFRVTMNPGTGYLSDCD